VNVPDPPAALAVKVAGIPTSVGLGLAFRLTVIPVTGLMVTVVLFEVLVTAIASVALTVMVKVVAVETM